MNKLLQIVLVSSFVLSTPSYGWSSLGHRVVAQIAYDNMTKEARRLANEYNHALDREFKRQSFVNSAAWLDSLYGYPNYLWLKPMHYISLPFSFDGTRLIPPKKANAVYAIEESKAALLSKADNFSKGFNLRILIHVVADLHQPLHAASQFSVSHPMGDKGGNLVKLKSNPIAANLHSYWDKGGGLLKSKNKTNQYVKNLARGLEKQWPCDLAKMNLNPMDWAQESHQIAVNTAYQLKEGQKPDGQYQHRVKELTKERLALAGCRLAAILNQIASRNS